MLIILYHLQKEDVLTIFLSSVKYSLPINHRSTQTFIDRRKNNYLVVYAYNGVVYSMNKNEHTHKTWKGQTWARFKWI